MGLEYFPDHIGESSLPTDRQTISEWAIYLPDEVDRNKYIETCYLTGTVTLINTNAEVKHRVRIGKAALREIHFPVDSNDLGSEVICVTSPFSGKLFVVDAFDPITAYTVQKENQYRISKATINGFADMLIDGDKGVVQIGVRSEQDGGIIALNISNASSTAQLKIVVNGTCVLHTKGDIDLTSFEGDMHLLSKAIQLLDGSLGGLTKTQELKTQLDKLNNQLQAVISSLQNWIPVPNDGGAALKTYFNTQISGKVAGDFSNIENANITHGIPLS